MLITAKYSGFCAATGARILAGDLIDYKRGKAVLVERATAGVVVALYAKGKARADVSGFVQIKGRDY